ncbi:HAMP domain-containing sensor histidine kinase [Hymenobacter algoricola]|uniref:histidine kinase n=1 Tax=Hymenobacter algoricola TaxID=486267 RepID=A0ABP7MC39_9BACT
MLFYLLLGFLAGAALLGGAGWGQRRRTRRALASLTAQVHSLTRPAGARRLTSPPAADTFLLTRGLNELLERQQAAADEQQHLVALAAHQLRTPLTSITAQIEVTLIRPRSVERHEETWRSVLQDITSFNHLADDLLLLAQLSAGRLTTLRPVAPDEVLYRAGAKLKARRPGYEIELDFDPLLAELPGPLTIFGDADLLEHAFRHLLDNGCRFSPGQRVQVRLSLDEKNAVLQFQDRGPGIAAHELPYVFEPFFIGENGRQLPGHGLGLPLAQRVVQLHRGSIAIAAEPAGTVVTVRLPLK